MIAEARLQLDRRKFFCACCAGTFLAWAPARPHAADETIVPVIKEPRHHTRLENEFIRIIEAIIEPGDMTMFHEHALDSVIVTAWGAKVRNEQLNNPQARIGQADTGVIAYQNYLDHPLVHRVANLDDHKAVFLDCEIITPKPGQFTIFDRSEAPAYIPAIDNERMRAWRLMLEPGQSVPPIMQAGPGVRTILKGDRFKETVHGAPDRDVRIQQGNYEWQPPGRTRGVTNTGNTPLELVEFEIR